MIETKGWALEPVPRATGDAIRRRPATRTRSSFPAQFGFPEVVVFGLTPVAASGLLDLVADLLGGGTEIPLGVELIGSVRQRPAMRVRCRSTSTSGRTCS